MSVFDFPRISFAGTVTLNPGTANNDDYSGGLKTAKEDGFPDLDVGENFAFFDSVNVKPRTHGLSDDEWLQYIQKARPTTTPDGSPSGAQIPSEWNYYGDMTFNASPKVVGVQLDANSEPLTAANPNQPLSNFLGEKVNLYGKLCDVNSEGSPPATQVFLGKLILPDSTGTCVITGQPNKGACQWINFTRNVNRTSDEGAGGYFYHVLPTTEWTLPGTAPEGFAGYVLRYYIFAKHDYATANDQITALYEASQKNPFAPTNQAEFEIAGSITPLFASETIFSGPVGRLLIQNTPNLPSGDGTNNSGATFALAPAVVHADEARVSAEFLGSFPEIYNVNPSVTWDTPNQKNPKYDIGDVALHYTEGANDYSVPVNYAYIAGGNARGWVFDYPLSAFKTSGGQSLSAVTTDGTFHVTASKADGETTLAETDYQVVSNAQSLYAEQDYAGHPGSGATSTTFVNQGYPAGKVSFELYYRGAPVPAASAPDITLWGYKATPLIPSTDDPTQPRTQIAAGFKPGDPIKIDTSAPGNHLLTFEIASQCSDSATNQPPDNYAKYITDKSFMTLCNRMAISIRILPNEDYSQYYDDPTASPPVANDSLTWDVVYQNVLRTYYLLFPTMQRYFDLSSEDQVRASIPDIRQTTTTGSWMSTGYMPVTRDMSNSRRDLLFSWFNVVDPPKGS